MDKWKKTTLGILCEESGGNIQTGPFGSQLHASDYVPVGIPSIMPQNIGDNRISVDGIARIKKEDAQRLSRYLVKPGDIIYSRRGDVERRALIRENEDGWLCGTGCLRVRFGEKVKIDSIFMSHYLGDPIIRSWIVQHAVGATMPNLNTSILSNVPVLLPTYAEQKAIAAVLGALDDKIELNRQMNTTLEAMARALFKSWFVDFDPVRAKMEGKQPFGMDTATAALFPSRLIPSSLGDIPEGWAVDEIGNVVTAVGGSTPSTEKPEYWAGGHHAWATPKDLSNLKSPVLLTTERQITDAGISVISSGLLPAGTVLMSSRAPIGYIAIPEVPVAVNQGFIAMVCNKKLPNLYVWLWTHNNLDTIKNHSNGSTFQEISKGSFRPLPCIVPTDPVLQKFQEIISPVWQKIVSNTKETVSLEKQRDYLLPKLISGDIRIPDAEKFMEAA